MRLYEVSDVFLGVACRDDLVQPLQVAVVHQTGGHDDEQGAAFLHSDPSGSVHMVGDADSAYILAKRSERVCGVKDVNSWTWHYENGAPFSFRVRDWLANFRMVRRCAWHIARLLVLEGLPLRYLTTEDLDAGRTRGWTYHRNLSLSRLSTSTHVDPVRWPHLRFRVVLRLYYLRHKARLAHRLVVRAA